MEEVCAKLSAVLLFESAAYFVSTQTRHGEVTDLSDLDQEAVEKVANDIEEKLHNLYQDINPKYKNKYRSLLFNLKDSKNPVGQHKLIYYHCHVAIFLLSYLFISLSLTPPPPFPPVFLSLPLPVVCIGIISQGAKRGHRHSSASQNE